MLLARQRKSAGLINTITENRYKTVDGQRNTKGGLLAQSRLRVTVFGWVGRAAGFVTFGRKTQSLGIPRQCGEWDPSLSVKGGGRKSHKV